MIHDIKWTRWTVKDLRFMFGQVYELVYKPCVCGLGWLWREFCLTLRFFKLPGLVGDGLGDFAEWGVDSWLSGVPFTTKKKGKNVWVHQKKKCTKFVNEAQQIFQEPPGGCQYSYIQRASFSKACQWVRREEIAHTAAPASYTRIPKQILFG